MIFRYYPKTPKPQIPFIIFNMNFTSEMPVSMAVHVFANFLKILKKWLQAPFFPRFPKIASAEPRCWLFSKKIICHQTLLKRCQFLQKRSSYAFSSLYLSMLRDNPKIPKPGHPLQKVGQPLVLLSRFCPFPGHPFFQA